MNKTKFNISTFIITALLITSCIKTNETIHSQYSVQGCLVGGFGAGILAYIKYHGDSDSNQKVAIASMMGCMAGAIAGYQIGKRTEEYADAQSAARAEIKRNEMHISELKLYNAQLEQNIKDYQKEIKLINDSTMSQLEKSENLKKTKEITSTQRTKAIESLKTVNDEIELAKSQYNRHKSSIKPANRDDWEDKIASLEIEKDILLSHVNTLNTIDVSI